MDLKAILNNAIAELNESENVVINEAMENYANVARKVLKWQDSGKLDEYLPGANHIRIWAELKKFMRGENSGESLAKYIKEVRQRNPSLYQNRQITIDDLKAREAAKLPAIPGSKELAVPGSASKELAVPGSMTKELAVPGSGSKELAISASKGLATPTGTGSGQVIDLVPQQTDWSKLVNIGAGSAAAMGLGAAGAEEFADRKRAEAEAAEHAAADEEALRLANRTPLEKIRDWGSDTFEKGKAVVSDVYNRGVEAAQEHPYMAAAIPGALLAGAGALALRRRQMAAKNQ